MNNIRDQKVDEHGVDIFAKVMKAKLQLKREQGLFGWHAKEECTIQQLEDLLAGQMGKKELDYVDIANYAMMIWFRKYGVTE